MRPSTRTVRIFLSSPGDVADDRKQARDLLLGLAHAPFVRGRVKIDVVSLDDPQDHASEDLQLHLAKPEWPPGMDPNFPPRQQALNPRLPTPAECDLTVVLLWSRMGTPIPEKKADGTPYLSGTEWEFENALNAGRPVLLYRRSEKLLLDPDDPDFDLKLVQKRRVDSFFAGFVDEVGMIGRSYTQSGSTDDLLTRLRQDVEMYMSQWMRVEEAGDSERRSSSAVRVKRAPKPRSKRPQEPVAAYSHVRRIFLCYRRADSGTIVGRIHDRLTRDFGDENIFKDLDNIPFGVDFVDYVDSEVQKCGILFAVIGPRWLEMGPHNAPRLDDPNDFVRIEIASALRRTIPVVPLLVDGAQMPRADQLPEEIKPLARRNGTEIRHDPDFHADMTRLLSRLG